MTKVRPVYGSCSRPPNPVQARPWGSVVVIQGGRDFGSSRQLVLLEDLPRDVWNGRLGRRGVPVKDVAAVDGAQGDVGAPGASGVRLADAVRHRDRAGAVVQHAPFIEVGLRALEIPL